ncbi:ABC transporter permease [Microbacterium sp.]|uniref:ABC transporter permease n=1 Tax=Microbacterium sp. TaxID=51671 RepID=UPI00333E7EA3
MTKVDDSGRGGSVGPPRTEVIGRPKDSTSRAVLRRLLRDRTSVVALSVIAVLAVVAVLAPVLVELLGRSALQPDRKNGLTPAGVPVGPGAEFWLGTDFVGRDIFSRILLGTSNTFLIAIVSALAAIVIGTAIGTIAGLYGGVVDVALSAVIDFVVALPFLVIAMAVVVIHGASVGVLMLTIAFFSWSTVARMVRSLVLTIRELDYVKAATTLGASDWRIVTRHILPNIAGPVLTYGSLLIPQIIVMEASLSFLGLGVPPPAPTWGGMIAENQGNYAIAWWSILFPGVALLLSTLSFNLLGDGLRDAMEPGSRPRRRHRTTRKEAR